MSNPIKVSEMKVLTAEDWAGLTGKSIEYCKKRQIEIDAFVQAFPDKSKENTND